MISLAAVDDLAQRLGAETTVDYDRADAALGDASALVRAEAGLSWVNDDGTLSADLPALIPPVVLQVALRLYRNPDAIRSEAVAGYSVAYQIDAAGLALTAEERRLVRRALGRSTVVSMELEGPWVTPPGYLGVTSGTVPSAGGQEPFPDPFGAPW